MQKKWKGKKKHEIEAFCNCCKTILLQTGNVEKRLDIRNTIRSKPEETEAAAAADAADDLREYQRPFDVAKLTSRRNDDVYSKLHWIVESDYFQALVDRKPRNDDPEVIDIIR